MFSKHLKETLQLIAKQTVDENAIKLTKRDELGKHELSLSERKNEVKNNLNSRM